MYKELVVYLCSHCVLTGSAASTDATIAKLFGKYLLAEHEYTETDSSSDSLVFWKHSQSSEDLRSFAIPTRGVNPSSRLGGGQTRRGSGGRESPSGVQGQSPAGSRGRAPGGGLGLKDITELNLNSECKCIDVY